MRTIASKSNPFAGTKVGTRLDLGQRCAVGLAQPVFGTGSLFRLANASDQSAFEAFWWENSASRYRFALTHLALSATAHDPTPHRRKGSHSLRPT
jgi:hypothetical protein